MPETRNGDRCDKATVDVEPRRIRIDRTDAANLPSREGLVPIATRDRDEDTLDNFCPPRSVRSGSRPYKPDM